MELEHCVLFRGLSRDVNARIRSLARIQRYARDETLFLEGDPATDIYVLKDGRVELTYTLPQDPTSEILIAHVHPGENFAWSALARGETLSSRARALVDSNVYAIALEELHALFLEHPEAGYQVMTILAQQILRRLRDTRKELRWLHQGVR
ncbi:MAG: cyclic nucleotide-binding domain-containing protein [Planctomycetes bacterium]|nr:cyclic nucleotide-binding domain-containing protein [Planctomycetota bacterium]